MIASVPGGGDELTGRTLDEIVASQTQQPVDVLLDLLAHHGGGVEVVIFAIGEEDIRRVMSHSEVAVASDGWILHPDTGGCPHPRKLRDLRPGARRPRPRGGRPRIVRGGAEDDEPSRPPVPV